MTPASPSPLSARSEELVRGMHGSGFPRPIRAMSSSSRRQDLSVVGHSVPYRDLSESTNIDLGVSYFRQATTTRASSERPSIHPIFMDQTFTVRTPLR